MHWGVLFAAFVVVAYKFMRLGFNISAEKGWGTTDNLITIIILVVILLNHFTVKSMM